MDKLDDELWKSWADNWDKKNPSNFVKACADSKARQEHARKQSYIIAPKINISPNYGK